MTCVYPCHPLAHSEFQNVNLQLSNARRNDNSLTHASFPPLRSVFFELSVVQSMNTYSPSGGVFVPTVSAVAKLTIPHHAPIGIEGKLLRLINIEVDA